jgi:hypothetical protein
MYPGRSPGSRTIQGLTIKSAIEKVRVAAEEGCDLHTKLGIRIERIKTIQNLASAIFTAIVATVTLWLAMHSEPEPASWPVWLLAATAIAFNTILVTRRHPEQAAVHIQIAKRYTDVAAACQVSVRKYEDLLLEDTGLQALLDQHKSDLTALKRDAG